MGISFLDGVSKPNFHIILACVEKLVTYFMKKDIFVFSESVSNKDILLNR